MIFFLPYKYVMPNLQIPILYNIHFDYSIHNFFCGNCFIVIPLENYDEGHPAPTEPALTKDLCGQYFKIKVNVKTNTVFDFKVLTALKGWVGHAPQGRGALHI
jgi:hypothetical protein